MLSIEEEMSVPEIQSALISDELIQSDLRRASVSDEKRTEFSAHRNQLMSGRDKLRIEMRQQILDDEYANRIADAIQQVESAKTALHRTIFSMTHLSQTTCPSRSRITPLRGDDAWVTRGTDVMEVSVEPIQ